MEYRSIDFSAHAIKRMFERQISPDAVIYVVKHGEVIAEYKDDQPYPSFLLLGFFDDMPLHVVVGVNPDSNAARVITVYTPEQHLWSEDYKARKKS